MKKINSLFIVLLSSIALIGCVTHSHDHAHDHHDHLKFGAPTEGMSKEAVSYTHLTLPTSNGV